MDRRTFLRGTALAGTTAIAGCGDSGGSGGDGDGGGGGSDGGGGYGGDGTDRDSPEATPADTLPDSEVVELSGPPCEAVAGATFKSVEKREGGLGPERTATRVHWEVSFEDGEYEYEYSDVFASGSYSCTAEDGTATIEDSSGDPDRSYSGTYDAESGVLEWDGVRYRPVEAT